MFNGFEAFKKYQVEAASVEDFLMQYTKRGRHYGREEDYAQCRIISYTEDIEKYGYCIMSHHESVTGEVVSYYPKGSTKSL